MSGPNIVRLVDESTGVSVLGSTSCVHEATDMLVVPKATFIGKDPPGYLERSSFNFVVHRTRRRGCVFIQVKRFRRIVMGLEESR